ncbi:MAG: 5-methylcytosine restriction system specificity protein McrC [Bacteroidales bacterium]
MKENKKNKYVIQEHFPIPYDSYKLLDIWRHGMRLPGQNQGLDRWFFQWQFSNPLKEENNENSDKEYGYYASYVIGAQWVDKENTKPLVITTKGGCDNIDFLKMFSTCFNSGIAAEDFSKIYEVDMEQPRIEAPELKSVLSPLIIVHFLTVVQEVLKHGLKKDYIQKENNLKKVKGHIAIARNERTNIIQKRFDRFFCKYQEYSENIPGNRLIKKALLFSREILNHSAISQSILPLQQNVNKYLSEFRNVDDQIEVWEIKNIKHHKVFKGYDEAIKLAKMILRRYDYSISNVTSEEEKCPVFWIDMALLYEHYVLGLLKEAYGDKIKYQSHGYSGYPDFICFEPQIVMDTKYIPRFEKTENYINVDIVRQLSGYSRDRKLFDIPPSKMIPCIIIYPKEGEPQNPFKNIPLEQLIKKEDNQYWKFYRVAVPLPTLSE